MKLWTNQTTGTHALNIHITYSTLLDEWREEAVETLDKCFDNHLSKVDSLLLDFADKAENINVQNHFFEAQRELWLKSDKLKKQFHEELVHALFAFPCPIESICEEIAQDEDDLALLDMEEYDKKLALQAIADQFERNNYQQIYAMQQRLVVVNHSRPISTKQVLASPHQVCCIYAHCVENLIMEKEALLVLYTVFEKEIVNKLPDLYESLNTHLVGAGVLPSLKYTFKKSGQYSSPAAHQPQKQEPAAGGGQSQPVAEASGSGGGSGETLVRIRELLSAGREKLTSRQPLPKGVQPATNQEVIHTVAAISDVTSSQFPEEIHIRQAAAFLSAPLAPVEPLERRIRQRDRHSSEHGKPGLDRRENRASPLVLPEPCHRPVEEVAGIDDHETRYYEQDNIPCRRPHAVCRLLRCSCICGPWPGGATRSVPRAPHEQYQQICRIQKCANVLRQLG